MDQAVVDETGRLIEFVGTTMDVSDRKQAEVALDAARAELARVTRTTTMGELAASIAHEVNQPLAAVVANANACHRWLAREVPDVQQARAAALRVIKDGKRAGDVIAGIRSLFKQSPMELGPFFFPLPPRGRDQALELLRQRILVRKSLVDDLPPVQGDGVQLQQVVLNLITNAIQAMSGVPDRARELVIGVSRGDMDGAPGLLVTVQDMGVDFNPEQEGKLFDAFYTTKSDGLGMGLGISRSIIELLGLHCGIAQSRPRRDVPVRLASELLVTPGDPIVLVLDDDPAVGESIADLLRSADLASEVFTSPQEFLRHPRPAATACLILDVQLAGLSGLDLQTDLAKGDPPLPIIFITGHATIPMSVLAMKRGAVRNPRRSPVRRRRAARCRPPGACPGPRGPTASGGAGRASGPVRHAYPSRAGGPRARGHWTAQQADRSGLGVQRADGQGAPGTGDAEAGGEVGRGVGPGGPAGRHSE